MGTFSPGLTVAIEQSTHFSQQKWGFCLVKGVPVDPESTKTLLERIAFIRHTHYGMNQNHLQQTWPLGINRGQVDFGISRPTSPSRTQPIHRSSLMLTQTPHISRTRQDFSCSTSCRIRMVKVVPACLLTVSRQLPWWWKRSLGIAKFWALTPSHSIQAAMRMSASNQFHTSLFSTVIR